MSFYVFRFVDLMLLIRWWRPEELRVEGQRHLRVPSLEQLCYHFDLGDSLLRSLDITIMLYGNTTIADFVQHGHCSWVCHLSRYKPI